MKAGSPDRLLDGRFLGLISKKPLRSTRASLIGSMSETLRCRRHAVPMALWPPFVSDAIILTVPTTESILFPSGGAGMRKLPIVLFLAAGVVFACGDKLMLVMRVRIAQLKLGHPLA